MMSASGSDSISRTSAWVKPNTAEVLSPFEVRRGLEMKAKKER